MLFQNWKARAAESLAGGSWPWCGAGDGSELAQNLKLTH